MGRRETTFISVVILCCFLSELKWALAPSEMMAKGLGKYSMQLESLQRILSERHLHEDRDYVSSFFTSEGILIDSSIYWDPVLILIGRE